MDLVLLSLDESRTLERLESIIESGLKTFIEVGNALLEIRDSRLYRQTSSTFEEYCRERWKMSRPQAYRLIDAATVVQNLSPLGDIPTNERQVRPLTKLEPEQQHEAWNAAIELNPKPTAAQVQEAVARTIEKAIADARKDAGTEQVQIKLNGEKRPAIDKRWIEFFGAIRDLLGIDPFDSETILLQYFDIYDDEKTVSDDLRNCSQAIDRIRKITNSLKKRFPHVRS